MAGSLPNRIDLFDAVRANLKAKGLFFVFGEDLREATRACLIELLSDQYNDLSVDVMAQIDTHTERFVDKAPYFWKEAKGKRDAIIRKSNKHAEFWNTEIRIEQTVEQLPVPERQLVAYDTASESTQNRRKRKFVEKTAPGLMKDGLVRKLKADGNKAGAKILERIVSPDAGDELLPQRILDFIHKVDSGYFEDNVVKVSTIRALASKIGSYLVAQSVLCSIFTVT